MPNDKPYLHRAGVIASLVLAAVLILFAFQNAAVVELKFGPFAFTGRRFMVIAVSFLIGFAMALTLTGIRRLRRK